MEEFGVKQGLSQLFYTKARSRGGLGSGTAASSGSGSVPGPWSVLSALVLLGRLHSQTGPRAVVVACPLQRGLLPLAGREHSGRSPVELGLPCLDGSYARSVTDLRASDGPGAQDLMEWGWDSCPQTSRAGEVRGGCFPKEKPLVRRRLWSARWVDGMSICTAWPLAQGSLPAAPVSSWRAGWEQGS